MKRTLIINAGDTNVSIEMTEAFFDVVSKKYGVAKEQVDEQHIKEFVIESIKTILMI